MHFIQQYYLLKLILAVAILTALVTLTTHSSPLVVHATEATTPPILISELYPAPPTGEPEWIELYNTTAEPIELVGWTLEDQLTTPSTIFIFTTQTIGPHEYLVVTLPVAKLNNSGDGIVVKNNQTATVHSISYEGSSPGSSWSVAAGGELYVSSPTPGSVNAPQPTPTPTPAPSPNPATPAPTPAPTPLPSPTPTPSPATSPTPEPLTKETEQELLKNIALTEINPCPVSGQPEWIELHNASTSPITFSNWKITDEAGNTRSISGNVPATSYQTISWSGSLLNNSGDSLTLTTPLGNTIATTEYQDCQVGTTFYLLGNSWLSGPPTPGTSPHLAETSELTTAIANNDVLQGATTSTQTDLVVATAVTSATLAQTHRQSTAALYAQQPLPNTTINTGAVHTTNQTHDQPPINALQAQAIIAQSNKQTTFYQSVILGGVFFLVAGGYSWYVQSETSPFNLVERLFATSTLGQPDFLS